MNPLEKYLAEELAASYVMNEAQKKILNDTNERLHMAIEEVRRLNTFLSSHERTMLRVELDNNRLVATVARNELEIQSMKAIIRTLQESVSTYRSEEKAKVLSAKRTFPRSFQQFLDDSRDRQLGDLEERIREQLDTAHVRNRNVRRRMDFTEIQDDEEEDDQDAQQPLRFN